MPTSVEVVSPPPAPDPDLSAGGEAPITDAGARWAERLERWAIPEEILAQAPVSPWPHDTAMFVVDDTLDPNTPTAEIARAVLPAVGGSVLDVGCGGGRAAMSLVPPAEQVIGVDQSPAMLAEFTRAATVAGARSMTVEGRWPDAAVATPSADVVVCHHVAYNVADIEPFLLALTSHARLATVIVLPPRHPLSAWNDTWHHFWGLERPTEPTADDLAEVLAGLGLDAERWNNAWRTSKRALRCWNQNSACRWTRRRPNASAIRRTEANSDKTPKGTKDSACPVFGSMTSSCTTTNTAIQTARRSFSSPALADWPTIPSVVGRT